MMNSGLDSFLNIFIQYFPRVIVLLVCLPIHEISHAFTANYFGDDTPKIHGRLTLNPFAHLDVLGSFLIIFQGFGWAKPVPVNPTVLRMRSPSAMMWVSLAGPLSNLILAVLAFFPLKIIFDLYKMGVGDVFLFEVLIQILYSFVGINILLAVFNLLPLSPLDGEKVIEYFLPDQMKDIFNKIRPYSPLILIGVVFLLPWLGIDLFGYIMAPIFSGLQFLLGV
jgi:Zn-dependent protease